MGFNKVLDTMALNWAKKTKAINLLGGECIKCGNSNVFQLSFHHSGVKNKKRDEIGFLIKSRWSKVEEELSKCQLLCENCHSELHYRDGRASKLKKNILEQLKIENCYRCGYSGDNFQSLIFHHVGEKRFSISNAFCRKEGVSVQELMDEIKKCVVICRNCHALEHKGVSKEIEAKIKYKVEHHKEVRPALDKNEVFRMYDGGMRQIDIVRHYGCSKGTICGIIKNRNA